MNKAMAFLIFKWAVYALLATNVVFYFFFKSMAEVYDQVGWVLLIGMFEYETTTLDQEYTGRFEKIAISAARILAYGLIVDAAVEYYMEGIWLDLVNAATWLLVCATLEYDVYFPGEFGNTEWKIRNAIKGALYAVLLVCAVLWGYEGDILNVYDAFLWILCFAVIELNIFQFETEEEEKAEALAEPAGGE